MARNVIAIFPDPARAEAAIAELVADGVPRDALCVVTHDAKQRYRELATLSDAQRRSKARAGLGGGALLGAATGALIALGVSAVPGFWIIGGPAASLLAGGGIGALLGGVAGGLGAAFDRMGIPEGPSLRYEEALRRGATMVAARVEDERARHVAALLERHGPVDVDRSAKRWEAAGWRIGGRRRAYGPEVVERERQAWEAERLEREALGLPGDIVRSYPVIEEPEPV